MEVAFIGHRNIERTEALRESLKQTIERLIVEEHADTFFFGSRSDFNDLCYEVVTELRNKHRLIKRVFIRAEYENINRVYEEYLSTLYEMTVYPDSVRGAHALSYIKRNQVMIDKSDVLVTYCDMKYTPTTRTKSGTQLAVAYAKRKCKNIVNLFYSE